MPTPTVENYVKQIYLEQQAPGEGEGAAEALVPMGRLAAAMGVVPGTATTMVKALADSGLVVYEPRGGVRLSRGGEQLALHVLRRHRLVELFLTRVLGLDWSEVDAEAEALEHAISPRLEQAMAAHLGEPVEDPHGHPIPTREGSLAHRTLQRLCDFQAGQRVLIREVQDDNSARLRRWQELGLVPVAVVVIVSHHGLEDVFEVQVGDRIIPLGSEGLAGLRGERLAE